MPKETDTKITDAIPEVIKWIDNLLKEHASKAVTVESKKFERLPFYYSKGLLSKAKVVTVEKVPVPQLSSLGLKLGDFESNAYCGMTYKDTFFVSCICDKDESTHFHELVHVIQWEILGAEKFLAEYAMELVTYGYRNCPLEKMAYGLQERFENDEKEFDVEKAVIDLMKKL